MIMAIAASGYALATVGMKMASGGVTPLAISILTVGLLAAVLTETFLMRYIELEIIYIGIVVLETILVLAYASYIGGALSLTQMAGAMMALAGFAMVTLGE
jgi:hypothetical protein